jgi:hypothetical protein
MNKIPVALSVGGYAYQHVTDWVNKYDNQTEKFFKQISAEFAYTGIMVFSALETLARGVHVLVLKGVRHLVEESKKKEFTKKHLVGAAEGFLMSASVAGGAALSLKDNLYKVDLSGKTTGQIVHGNATVEKVTMFYYKTFPTQLRALGFRVP